MVNIYGLWFKDKNGKVLEHSEELEDESGVLLPPSRQATASVAGGCGAQSRAPAGGLPGDIARVLWEKPSTRNPRRKPPGKRARTPRFDAHFRQRTARLGQRFWERSRLNDGDDGRFGQRQHADSRDPKGGSAVELIVAMTLET